MEAFFEILIPLLVVIYFVFSFFKGLVSRDDEPLPPDSEDEEARKIQEEIRRKIVARQQGREVSGQSGQSSSPGPVAGGPPPLQPSLEERLAEQAGREYSPFDQGPRTQREAPKPPELFTLPTGFGQSGASGNNLEKELADQRSRLAVAQEERERVERASRDRLRRTQNRARRDLIEAKHSSNVPGSDEILELLQTDEGLKKAFILREVLDRPIALRQLHDSFSDFSR